MTNLSSIFSFRNYSLRTKLLLSILFITGLSVVLFGVFFFLRTQQSQALLDGELKKTVQQQAEQQLANIILAEARFSDQILANVTFALHQLGDYQTSLYARKASISGVAYWDSREKLAQLPDGQFGNPKTDTSSLFVPNTVSLTDSMLDDMNLNIYLDFNAPAVMSNSPDVVGLYFISAEGYTIYYPNIELAKVAPPNFDPRTQPYYVSAMPENNPGSEAVWIAPYQDTAGTGLIVTNSIPVYDNANRFRGVLGADVQLTTIAAHTLTVTVGKTGFAFMVDKDGHIISLPDFGYQLFGVEEEDVPVGETPKFTLLGHGSPEFQSAMQNMGEGGQGIAVVDFGDVPYYIAYASLPTTGYSMGLVVPVAELEEPYFVTRAKIEAETQSTLNLAAIILAGILIVASVISIGLSSTISNPLVKLTQIAEQIRGGNLDAKASVESQDEIGVLAHSFNDMSSQLQESFLNLEQRVSDRTKALATTGEISRKLSTMTDRSQLVSGVVEQLQSAFDYYHAHIYLLDASSENLLIAGGTGEAGKILLEQGHSIPVGRGLVGRAAEDGEVVLVPDTSQSIGWLPNPLLPNTKAEVAVPIMVGQTVLGVLDVQNNETNSLSEEDASLIRSIADQVAIALQNIRANEISVKRARELQVVANISSTAAAMRDAQEMLAIVVHLTQRQFGLYHCHVFTYEPDSDLLRIRACGYREGDVHEGTHGTSTIPLAQEQSLVARAARTRSAVIVNDVRSDPGWLPNPLLPETASEMAVPMIVGDQLIGVLDVQSELLDRFTDEDASIKTTLAAQIATALQNIRAYAQAQKRAEFQATLGQITQKIQSTDTVEAALQIAARELGHALGQKPTLVKLDPSAFSGKGKVVDENE